MNIYSPEIGGGRMLPLRGRIGVFHVYFPLCNEMGSSDPFLFFRIKKSVDTF